eukprot:NODE_7720_length_747_cov_109.333333_g7470_i0.p1 GENE.NODE_7720_length_747_cov_109.333333_g7470_i0~~NODE_7720_length_747_cov_109.333333_g7470_i0.p1  ORF type:complete len:156 (+),score=42.46 NODE_7720_length_747_cov_109.333333_g7470_i0:75-542(+)
MALAPHLSRSSYQPKPSTSLSGGGGASNVEYKVEYVSLADQGYDLSGYAGYENYKPAAGKPTGAPMPYDDSQYVPYGFGGNPRAQGGRPQQRPQERGMVPTRKGYRQPLAPKTIEFVNGKKVAVQHGPKGAAAAEKKKKKAYGAWNYPAHYSLGE